MKLKFIKFHQLSFELNILFKIEKYIFYILILFIPTQLGKHYWPDFSYVNGFRIDYLSPTIYFTDILVVLLFLIWIIRNFDYKKLKAYLSNIVRNKNNLIIHEAFTYILIIFGLVALIDFSDSFAKGAYISFKIFEMGFVGFYTAKFIKANRHISSVSKLLSVGVIFESIVAMAQFVNQRSIGGLLYLFGERNFNGSTPGIANASLNGELILRPYGTLPHPNVLAGYMLLSLILILFSLEPISSKKGSLKIFSIGRVFLLNNLSKIIVVISVMLGFVTIVLSMSRIAVLLWLIIISYFILKKVKHMAVIAVSIILILATSIIPISARFTEFKVYDEAVLHRVFLGDAAINMIMDNPLFGVGLGNFISELSVVTDSVNISTSLQPVHNIFILVAAEAGIFGFGLFVWFLWRTYIRVRNSKLANKEALIISLFTIITLGQFDHYFLTLQQGQLLFAFVIGLCWSRIRVSRV